MTNEPIRLINCGEVSAVRSQTVYHAVAYALEPTTPDTILLISPHEPYVSIGFHQDADKEVDLEYCMEHRLPVIRREVGGGAVYLDRNQLFCQWVFHPAHLPAKIEERFELYIDPIVGTYRGLGIAAEHRPINDIHVAGRKIGGTGAAQLGNAEVVVGSFMFDFDAQTMARVLRVPSEKFRDKVHQSLRDYMTTMRRELTVLPERDAIVAQYATRCQKALGRTVEPGRLSSAELETAEQLDERFASAEWLHATGGLRQHGVKVHEDLRVVESTHKAAGGLIRATAQLHGSRIGDIALTGDFTMQPASLVAALEHELRGLALSELPIRQRIERFYETYRPQSPGVEPRDWIAAVLALALPLATK